jgi:hypothetical protein
MGELRLPKRNPEAPVYLEVPRFWCERLRGANGSTYQLAFALLDYWRRFPGRPLEAGPSAFPTVHHLQRLGALAKLESLGLIVVRRQATKAPVITWVMDDPEVTEPEKDHAPTPSPPSSADTPIIRPGSAQWKAWVEYLSELGDKEELIAKMRRAEANGRAMKVPYEWPPGAGS